MKLWVDDLREPPDSTWVWVNHPTIAIWMMTHNVVLEISLDHDLGIEICGDNIGDDLTTRPIITWMIEQSCWPEKISVHSANPVGREWLEGTINRYRPWP